MSFPYSNAAVAIPLPGENQECFLHGLKVLFHQCGGVPKRIRIDNLTPAVKKIRSRFGEAELTDAFIQFQNHYGFEVQVCNPRSGHEKGSVDEVRLESGHIKSRQIVYGKISIYGGCPLCQEAVIMTNTSKRRQ